MSNANLIASDFVLTTIRSGELDDTGIKITATLTAGQYKEVDKFLQVAGAVWNRKAKRHLFKDIDAQQKLLSLLDTGTILNEQKAFQAYYTPPVLAEELVEHAGISGSDLCLEPSAGSGNIAEAMQARTTEKVMCVELNPKSATILRSKGFDVREADFLNIGLEPKFDRIVMNPPFTNDQDIKHVLKAYDLLVAGGVLVAVLGGGALQGTSKWRKIFADYVKNYGELIRTCEAAEFENNGSGARTIIVRLCR